MCIIYMLCIVFYIIFYWDGRLCYFFWHHPHYKAIMLLLLAYCQQYGYFVLDIEFLKALKRYSTNKYIAAWCVATLEMPSFEGAAAVGLKGRSSRKRFRQRLRKSWAAECLSIMHCGFNTGVIELMFGMMKTENWGIWLFPDQLWRKSESAFFSWCGIGRN